ncbi:hypothetical protein ACFFT9_16135 [Chromobacterium violaceum]|nr:hypothetical protein BS642_20600 [Chromobacterium violaceum]
MDSIDFLGIFGVMKLNWVVGANLVQMSCISINRYVQLQSVHVAESSKAFLQQSLASTVEAVIREVDRE